MTLFIKEKLKKSDDQTNVKYRVAANITINMFIWTLDIRAFCL